MQGCISRALGSALLAALTLVAAPDGTADSTVEGQITPYNSGTTAGVSVELTPTTGAGHYRTYADGTGAFRFDRVAAGVYELRVTTATGGVLYETTVNVRDKFTRVTVELSHAQQRPGAAGGTISLAELQHKIPGKALKEFRKSEELLAKGRTEEAASHLERAVAADPAFARAYSNLAACEANLKHYDKAAEYGRKAVQLDPGLPTAQLNLSHILLMLREYPGAEAAARAALRLDGQSGTAHLFLALALRAQRRPEEALQHFTRAADSVPAARLYAADLLVRGGKKDDAAGQLRAYLGAPGAENRDAVEQWLARLAK